MIQLAAFVYFTLKKPVNAVSHSCDTPVTRSRVAMHIDLNFRTAGVTLRHPITQVLAKIFTKFELSDLFSVLLSTSRIISLTFLSKFRHQICTLVHFCS